MQAKSRMSWQGLIVSAALIILVFVLLNVLISRNTAELKEQESSRRVDLSELTEELSDLKEEKKQIGTDVYIKTVARRDYGFVNEGELRFEFTNPEALETLTDAEYNDYKHEMAK